MSILGARSLTATITETRHLSGKSRRSCQVGLDLAALGKRWAYHILRNIGVLHVDRFNQILRSIPGLTPRVLIMRLNELEERGLIQPIVIKKRPRQVRWELTVKGSDAVPILEGYQSFIAKWYPDASLRNHITGSPKPPSLAELLEPDQRLAAR